MQKFLYLFLIIKSMFSIFSVGVMNINHGPGIKLYITGQIKTNMAIILKKLIVVQDDQR